MLNSNQPTLTCYLLIANASNYLASVASAGDLKIQREFLIEWEMVTSKLLNIVG